MSNSKRILPPIVYRVEIHGASLSEVEEVDFAVRHAASIALDNFRNNEPDADGNRRVTVVIEEDPE